MSSRRRDEVPRCWLSYLRVHLPVARALPTVKLDPMVFAGEESDPHRADMPPVAIETTIASRTHPTGGRRKLPLMPGLLASQQPKRPAHGQDPRLFPHGTEPAGPACHAGGRGFESRRSRFEKCLQTGAACCQFSAQPAIGPHIFHTARQAVAGGSRRQPCERPVAGHDRWERVDVRRRKSRRS
jgi:hypothetical protein